MDWLTLKDLDVHQLREKLIAFKREMIKLRVSRVGGETVKPHLFKLLRKSIARVNTLLARKEA